MRFANDSQRKAVFYRLNSFSRNVGFVPASQISDIRCKERADAIYTGVVSGLIDPDVLSIDDRQLFIDTQERLEKNAYDLRSKCADEYLLSSLKDDILRSKSKFSKRFVRPDYLRGDRRFVSVEVSVPKFEKAWRRNPQNHFEKCDVCSPERYEGVVNFIKSGKKIDMPEVYAEPDLDSVKVADGRHRIAGLRDNDYKRMDIIVPEFQKDYFEERFK